MINLEKAKKNIDYTVGYLAVLNEYVMVVHVPNSASVGFDRYYKITENEYYDQEYIALYNRFCKKGIRSRRFLFSALSRENNPRQQELYDRVSVNRSFGFGSFKYCDKFDCIPVREEDITYAESKIGRRIPGELREFLLDIGYGRFIGNKQYANKILSTDDIAELMCNDRSDTGIPFLMVSDGIYLVLRESGSVTYFDKSIADSLYDFWRKEVTHPDYFISGIT